MNLSRGSRIEHHLSVVPVSRRTVRAHLQYPSRTPMAGIAPLAPDLKSIRSLLAEHLPWSPQDYVAGLSREADCAIWAEQLTSRLAEGDDLRFKTRSGDADVMVLAERLPWDSDFFGYGVARLNGVFPLAPPLHDLKADLSPAIETLLDEARRRDIKYLFAPVDPRDLSLLRALGQNGFSLIESRLHYYTSVQMVHYLRLPDHTPEGWSRFREATADDIPSLSRVVRETVNPYDRFHGDPFIRRDDADRLMEKWVEQSVLGHFADLTVVPDVAEPGGFISYRFHRDKWERWGVNLVQSVLAAVTPEYLGWFMAVTPELNRHLRSIGAHHCFGKTQITLGLDSAAHFGKGEHILRIVL